MKVDFLGEEQAPDATTLCKFRKLLNDNGITKLFFETMTAFMDQHGKIMHGGTIVDATIIEALVSVKLRTRTNSATLQVKKGNEWHFGVRMHVGVDAGTGQIHSVEVTAANVGERDIVPQLVREDDEVLYGDAGYTGLSKRPEFQADAHQSSIDYRINTCNRYHWPKLAPGFDWDRYIEHQKSRVRCKVEYVFLIIKRIFGCRKVREESPKIEHRRLLYAFVPICTYLGSSVGEGHIRNAKRRWVIPHLALSLGSPRFRRSLLPFNHRLLRVSI